MGKAIILLTTIVLALLIPAAALVSFGDSERGIPFASPINILSPSNGTTYNTRSLVLNVSFTALIGSNLQYSMTYNLDAENNVSLPITIQQRNPNDPFVGIITGFALLPELSEGTHNITVYATCYRTDPTPHITGFDTKTVYFTIDTTPPIITILSPENKTYNRNELPLDLTINEPVSWISYCLDGKANITIPGNTTLKGLSNGSHKLTVYANDTVGNMGNSTIYFSIAQSTTLQAEFIYSAAGISASGIIIAGAMVLKRKRINKH